VIRTFADKDTAALFQRIRVKKFQQIAEVALRRLVQIDSAAELRDLASPPANRLEALRGDRRGQYSVRVNDQYRVCFRWKDGDAYEVEIADYH
jgi:proteic killer suppression protein